MSDPALIESFEVELAKRAYEATLARARLNAAIRAAANAGISQRAIAAAVGTNQVSIHRALRQADDDVEDRTDEYERPEARFHLEGMRRRHRQSHSHDEAPPERRA